MSFYDLENRIIIIYYRENQSISSSGKKAFEIKNSWNLKLAEISQEKISNGRNRIIFSIIAYN